MTSRVFRFKSNWLVSNRFFRTFKGKSPRNPKQWSRAVTSHQSRQQATSKPSAQSRLLSFNPIIALEPKSFELASQVLDFLFKSQFSEVHTKSFIFNAINNSVFHLIYDARVKREVIPCPLHGRLDAFYTTNERYKQIKHSRTKPMSRGARTARDHVSSISVPYHAYMDGSFYSFLSLFQVSESLDRLVYFFRYSDHSSINFRARSI